MKPRSAIKNDLFATDHRRDKIDCLGDPLTEIGTHIDFVALTAEVERVAPRTVSAQGGPSAVPDRNHAAHSGAKAAVQPVG